MQIELTGHRSDPEVAWAQLGDTDFMNRKAECGVVTYELEPSDVGAARITGVMAGPGGLSMPFEETYNGWVRGRWFRQDRSYSAGPIVRSRFRFDLVPDGDGVVPRLALELEPRMRLFAPALALRARTIRTRWQEVLDGLPAPGAPLRPSRDLAAPLQAALARWSAHVPEEVVEGMRGLLRTGRDQQLREIRAYGLADQLGLPRQEVLRGMLQGVSDGLLEVYWSARCSRCRGEVGASTTLSNLADHADCSSCGISVVADLSKTVEVLFAPHPSVFPRTSERFCTLFPSGAPTLVAAFPLEAGEAVDEAVEVGSGEHLALGIGHGFADLDVVVDTDGAHALRWDPEARGETHIGAGLLQVAATNTSGARQRLVLRDAEADRAVVPAVDVATVPEFRRQLGTEVLATRIRVGSRRIALLFTDLSGSTALYEAVGDAAAYALVRDHFDLVRGAVEAHGGEVVKTIGDAVMASFERPDAAVEAALAMRDAFDRWMAETHSDLSVRLNVGVHVGMALGVHTDALGLDWFGQHVNLAARAQGAAKEGDLVLTEAVRDDPLLAPVLARHGELEAFEAELKGIGATRLYRWRRQG